MKKSEVIYLSVRNSSRLLSKSRKSKKSKNSLFHFLSFMGHGRGFGGVRGSPINHTPISADRCVSPTPTRENLTISFLTIFSIFLTLIFSHEHVFLFSFSPHIYLYIYGCEKVYKDIGVLHSKEKLEYLSLLVVK